MVNLLPSGKTTVPPLLQSSKACKICGTSSFSRPKGFTVHVFPDWNGFRGIGNGGGPARANWVNAKEARESRINQRELMAASREPALCIASILPGNRNAAIKPGPYAGIYIHPRCCSRADVNLEPWHGCSPKDIKRWVRANGNWPPPLAG
jgi:hypothetical protein